MIQSSHCAGSEHSILLPQLIILVSLGLFSSQTSVFLCFHCFFLLFCVLGTYPGERIVRFVIAFIQAVPFSIKSLLFLFIS